MIRLYSIGNWLFLLGSIVFTGDAVSEVLTDVSLRAIEHLSASILFTTGCVIFLLEPSQKENSKCQ